LTTQKSTTSVKSSTKSIVLPPLQPQVNYKPIETR
jgi:hypothetical protein